MRRSPKGLTRRVDWKREADLAGLSGFFDAEWYVSTYPEVLAVGIPPFQHYLEAGFLEGKNPGPLFDGVRYLAENVDVAQAGLNPLMHFLRSPPSEGRKATTVPIKASMGREYVTATFPYGFEAAPSLAVMVHGYYAETFDSICYALRSIPFPFTLLVSVPSESARRTALKSVRRYGLPGRADVRVCQNRGRNFGPLVTEFAQVIDSHEFLLHLHTKQSLYTGQEQTAWRDELIDTLVGSRAVVLASMGLLVERTDVGLLYPVTTSSLSYWAHHWLGSSQHAAALFSRLGVERYPTEGYFPYPVGGMFWARVDAIRPLLEAGISIEEFPEEAGQNDGTLAHAIERCFVSLAHARGYRCAEFASSQGELRLDWSDLNLDQYLTYSLDDLCRAIDLAEVVSFDIFDTLLTRLSVQPDSVMRAVGESIRVDYPAATDFFDRRKAAEVAAREAKDWIGDVSLTEIYRAFPRSGIWTEEAIADAFAGELDGELAVTVPRETVVRALRYAAESGKRVVGVSDTYLERAQIEHLLKASDLLDSFDAIYLSSESGHRKDRGDLWDYLLTLETARSDQWLHIGDNEHSDIQAATDRGLAAYHCMNPTTLFKLRGLGEAVATGAGQWGNDLLVGPSVARIANNPFPDNGHFEPVDLPDPFDLGYCIFGPVVMAFISWLANHPASNGIDHLYFCAREGFLLQQAWEKVRVSTGSELVPSTYLYTSRRASMASAQAVRFSPDDVIEGSDYEGKLADLLLSRLGLVLESDDPLLDSRVQLPRDEVVVREFLTSRRDRIVANGRSEMRGLKEYLHSVGLGRSMSAGIVDIGYSGTIQKHLQTVLGRGLQGFYMGTLDKARQVEASGGSAFGCFIENHPGRSTPSSFLGHSLVLEAFLTAPYGQTESSTVEDGTVVHRFRSDHRSQQELDVLDQLHRGTLSYCDDLLAAFGRSLLKAPTDPSAAFALVVAFAGGAIRSPRSVSALVVDDDFCGVERRRAPIASWP